VGVLQRVSALLRLVTETHLQGVFNFSKMDIEKVKAMNEAMQEMAKKYGMFYFELFGRKVLEGMDIETAVWYCYNKLNTKK
jgi:hypothetical protein